ncbi:MAG: hypothetical protein QM784_01555 [Polyangiaceae bacterium]
MAGGGSGGEVGSDLAGMIENFAPIGDAMRAVNVSPPRDSVAVESSSESLMSASVCMSQK